MTSNRLGPGTTLSSMSSEGPGSDSSDESSSAGEGLETEEQAEGRRQAKLLRRMLVELEGSVLRAWRKFFETENDGGRINEFQFVRMCRQIRFPADPVQVFRYLDDDGSGELTLEELDQEGNDLWANFVEWCAQIFSGATDFIQKLLPKNGDKKLTAAQFEEGIVKSGWSRGSESLLFSAVNLRGDDAIDALQKFPRGLGKGHDCALLHKWLKSVMDRLTRDDVPECCKDIFEIVKWGNNASNSFFHILYHGGLWLSRSEALSAAKHGWDMAEAYGGAASLAVSCGWKLWYLRPKNHMFLHTVAELEYQASQNDYVLNPLCFATWADEDFIGRVARQSRKVHSLAVSFRTISKTLMNYKYEWGKVCPRFVRPGPVC